MITADYLVVGAGIAGASIAYELAQQAQVVVLERELQPGYHSTGRSAAVFSEIYGNRMVRNLSRASRGYFNAPPPGFSEIPLLSARGALYIATAKQKRLVESFFCEADRLENTRALSTREAMDLLPVLRSQNAVHCRYAPETMDIEAATVHQAYLKGLRRNGGQVVPSCTLESIERAAGRWRVQTAEAVFTAKVLVNAAGAWADELAQLAGVRPIGLQPRRRTAMLVQPSIPMSVNRWPMLVDIGETFYCKPDAGRLLLSPADETPSGPCDAQPEDLDVAVAVDRLENATTLSIQQVSHRWAGLRSFVADRTPVLGSDVGCEDFFWVAGQGGYGIQTAPAMSQLGAALLLGKKVPEDLVAHGVSVEALSPRRLR